MERPDELIVKVRRHLTLELERRSKANPRYSLRAFAKSLSIDSSYLSKIMAGKRQLSHISLMRLSEKLDFAPQLIESLDTSLESQQFTSLELSRFRVISDWYHYAILEMTKLENFNSDPRWIATSLGISQAEALAAIQRLKDVHLLEIKPNGKWEIHNHSTTRHKYTDAAFRQLQKQILEQSINALNDVSFEERDQSSITMCIDKRRLKTAKTKIKKFRRDLMSYLEGGAKKDAVYQLSISLFPAIKTINNGNKHA